VDIRQIKKLKNLNSATGIDREGSGFGLWLQQRYQTACNAEKNVYLSF